MAGMQGRGVPTVRVSPPGSPVVPRYPHNPNTLMTLIVALTSRFDGEDRFCTGVMGVGSSRGYSSFLVDYQPRKQKKQRR